MTLSVSSAASPRALQRAKRKRHHAPAAPNFVATPQTRRVLAAVQNLPAAAVPAPAPAAPAPAAGTPTPAPAAPAEPAGPVASPEYDPVDIAGVVGDIVGSPYGGTTNDLIGPHVKTAIGSVLDPKDHPFLASPYGSVIPAKIAGTITNQIGGFVGGAVGNALRGVLHGKVKGVEEPAEGLGYTPPAANKLIAGTIKGITTSWMKLALTDALKPPPPPPAPVYPPDVKPLPAEPVPAPPPPKKVLLTDTAAIKATVTSELIRMGIGAIYDQTVGPLVQRAANVVTGRSGEEIKPPTPLTPGKVVSGLAEAVLGSFFTRSVEYKPLPSAPGTPPPATPPGTPFAGALGASVVNGILGAAWSTVYNRGMGASIENSVNEFAGIRSKEDQAKDKLPALEQFTRTAARGAAVGATTYVLGNALNASMIKLGASIGGVGGALVAMAGASLIGSIGGTAVDATVGPMLGKLGGQIYSWITGKPSYEQRMKDAAAKPGPTPGDPVKAPNGNPGTVPAPAPAAGAGAAPAPAPAPAPAAGAVKKRKKTGNKAVDATSPAINVPKGAFIAAAKAG